MSDAATDRETTQKTYPANVVAILGSSRVVIDRGAEHDVDVEDRFLVYEVSDEEIVDLNGESLGKLEIPKGTGKVIHVQDRMAIIESDREKPPNRRVVRRPSTFGAMVGQQEEEEYLTSQKLEPFFKPIIGDLAKPM